MTLHHRHYHERQEIRPCPICDGPAQLVQPTGPLRKVGYKCKSKNCFMSKIEPVDPYEWQCRGFNTPSDKLVHRGLWANRLVEDSEFVSTRREIAFAAEWTEENRHIGNEGTLVTILSVQNPNEFLGNYHQAVINQNTATVAATIIQWLGTNCGWCFLERAIERAGFTLVRKEK